MVLQHNPLEWVEMHRFEPALTWRQWLYERREYLIYRLDERPSGTCRLARNDWSALTTYIPQKGWQSKQAFEDDCTQRMQAGETIYTLSVNGRLAAMAWLVAQGESLQTAVRQVVPFLPQSAACYGVRVLTGFEGKGMGKAIVRGVACDAFDRGLQHVYTSVSMDNKASRRIQECVGFKPVAVYGYRCFLGNVRKWRPCASCERSCSDRAGYCWECAEWLRENTTLM